jgi:hypothetical protein
MSTPGDARRAQRKAAREESKPQATDLTPIEEAIRRALAKNARNEKPPEDDARVIARIVVKHWGDDSVGVLERALELARERVRR